MRSKYLVFLILSIGFMPMSAMAQRSIGVDSGPGQLEEISGTEVQNRVQWRAAFRDSGTTDGLASFAKLMHESTSQSDLSPVATAFHAAAQIMTTSKKLNPLSKLLGFRKWTSVLDEQAARIPVDADIRLLRLTIQLRAPGFLGYRGELDPDCMVVREALGSSFWSGDPEHEAFIIGLFAEEDACNSMK